MRYICETGAQNQSFKIKMYAFESTNNLSIDVWFQYLKIWILRVQKKIEILRKSSFKLLVMHITNQKFSFYIF